MQVILEGLSVTIKLDHAPLLPYSSLKSAVKTTHQVDLDEFSVYLSGRLLTDESMLLDLERSYPEHLVLRVQSRVLGGKGGFGSQLKAIGAQIHKTTSREACRDLSGRRVRDVNAEKRFHQLAREEKRRVEERKQQKLKRREKRWAQRTTRPKLEDPLYYQSLEKDENRVNDALKHAQQMNGKRVSDNHGVTGTKRLVFRGMGDLTDSESDLETGVSCNEPPVSSVSIHTDLLSCTADSISEQHIHPVPTSSHSGSDLPNDETIICNEAIPSFQTEAVPVDTPIPDPTRLNTLPGPIDLNTPLPSLPGPIDLNTSSLPGPIDLNTSSLPGPIDLNTPLPSLPDPIDLNTPLPSLPDPIDLSSISCKEELEKFSLEILKITLLSFGLKCGGTLQERVDRLFTYKVTPRDQLHPSIFAGKGKSSKKLDKRSSRMGVGDIFGKILFSICGMGGSLCCMVFSLWGVIMLALLGVFFYIEAVALIEDIPPLSAGADNAANITMSYQTAGIGCFVGAGLYVGTFFLSLGFFIFDRVKPKIM